MKKLIIVLSALFFLSTFAYADLWEDMVSEGFGESYSDAEQDDSGYSYRGGIDFSHRNRGEAIEIGYYYDMGLGCGGFDLIADFLSNLNEEALTDYLEGQIGEIISASPSLLLAYVSPTLYDNLKNFQAQTRHKQLLNYYKCEDIVSAGESWIDKMRSSARKENLKEEQEGGASLTTAVKNVNEEEPFEGKKDYWGKELGSMYLVKSGLEWIEADDTIIDLGPNITGDFYIDTKSVKYTAPLKTTDMLLTDNRDTFQENLDAALKNYESSGEVSEEDLEKLSTPSVVITDTVIEAINSMPDYKSEIASGKLVSALALSKTSWQLSNIAEKLQAASHNPNIDDGQREELRTIINDLHEKRKGLLSSEEMERTVVAKGILEGIIQEYAAEKDEAMRKTRVSSSAEKIKEANESITGGFKYGFGGLR